MNQKVSIVMPVRNAMPYLNECLDSILSQSYTQWELLVVNDNSTDQSNIVLSEYAAQNVRIMCIQNKGKGIIDALNTGYDHSSGRFITRMDADDIMPPHKLESLTSLLKNVGKGYLATGKVKYIGETVLGDGFKKYERWLNQLCDEHNHFDEIYKECVIPSPCWMMWREDFKAIGGFDSNSYPEDYDLCFRMYENDIKVLPSNEILHIWRDHGGRASRNDDNYSDNRFLELKVKYFIRNELKSERKLILWGAGKKGKQIAKLFLDFDIQYEWITNNRNKIGKDIYGQKINSQEIVQQFNSKVNFIIAVANEGEQKTILEFINELKIEKQIFKFC